MKTLKIRLDDELHGQLAGAREGTGLSMEAIIVRGIGPELRKLARRYNGGKPWPHAKPGMGRPVRPET